MSSESRGPRWQGLFRRRRPWIIAVVVVLVLRAALPLVLRHVLASQATKALHTRVDIGDVDLSLLRGGVALKDVAVYASTAPAATEGGAPAEPPLIAWKRFAVGIRYLPLLRKAVRLREVALEGPHVALDRLADGSLNLQALLAPSPSAPPPATPQPAEPATRGGSWSIGIDRFVLSGGGVRFRDLKITGSEPLGLAIPAIEVADVSFQPGVYGEPGRAHVEFRSEGGVVRADARVALLEHGLMLEADLKARKLPLHRAQVYIPGVGWSDLRGEIDAALAYRLRTDERNDVRGLVRLRDLVVHTPALEQPALAWKRLAVWLEPLDLQARRATIGTVELAGLSVVVDPKSGKVLPLLGGSALVAPAEQAPPPAAEAESKSAPWRWLVRRFRLEDGHVQVLQAENPLAVAVTLDARDLAGDVPEPGHVDLGLAVGSGTVHVAGALRVAPPAFGGTLAIERLSLPELVGVAALVPPNVLEAAMLAADLQVEAGLDPNGAAAAPGTARVRGRVGLEGLRVVGIDPKTFAAGWKVLDVPIDDVLVPAVLPGAPPAPAPAPVTVALGAVRLEEPYVQLTRTADGIVLPPLAPATAPAPPAATTPAAPAPARTVAATVGSFVLARGRVSVVDRTVKPFFATQLNPLDVDARDIRSEGPTIGRFKLSAVGWQQGKLEVSGSLGTGGGALEVKGTRLALLPFNPYVTSFSSYSLAKGTLSVTSNVKLAAGRYDTSTDVALHDLALQGAAGDSLFLQQFGIPLTTALALLRDLNGDIKLAIPVTVDQSGTQIALGTIVLGALKSALLGAITSPLKLLGAVVGAGDQGGSLEPAPLPSMVGRAEFALEAVEPLGQLADLVASRPGIGLELTGEVGAADARWLREQVLRAKLAAPGLVGSIASLPERAARKRVLEGLTARAAGQPGELSAEDAKRLDEWVADVPPPAPDELARLARARAERAVAVLRDEHGIDANRLTVRDPHVEASGGKAGVRVGLSAVQ
jgi:hypothetical protein